MAACIFGASGYGKSTMLTSTEIRERNRLLRRIVRDGVEVRFGELLLQTRYLLYTEEGCGYETVLHRHGHYEFSLLLSGRMEYRGETGEGETLERPGLDWILIEPEFVHRRRALEEGSLLLGFALRLRNAPPTLERCLRGIRKPEGMAVRELTVRIEALIASAQPFRAERLRLLLTELLLEFFAANYAGLLPEEEPAAAVLDALEPAEHFIRENLTREIPVEKLARRAGLSRRHFHRLFLEKHGVPPKEYLIRQRLKYAAGLLSAGDRPVKEIAEAAGFRNLSYFSRQFRRLFSVPPARYRCQGT